MRHVTGKGCHEIATLVPHVLDPKKLPGWLLSRDRIATSVSIVLVFLIVGRVIVSVRGILFARLLGPDQYGIYTLAMFLVSLITTIATLGTQPAFPRYTPRYEASGHLRWFIKRIYLLTLVASLLLSVLLLVKPSFFSDLLYGRHLGGTIVIVAAISIPACLLQRNLSISFMALKFFRAGALQDLGQIVVFSAIGIPLLIVFRSAISVLLGFTVATYLSIVLFLMLILRYLRRAEPTYEAADSEGFYRRLIKFSIWFLVTPLLSQVFLFMDRFWLQHLKGTYDQGVYSAVGALSEGVSAVGLAINNVIFPHISATWESGQRDRALGNLDVSMRVTGVIFLIVATLLVLFGGWIIVLLLGDQYAQGTQVLPYLLVFHTCTQLVWLIGVYPTLIEKTYVSTIGFALAIPVNFGLNQVLIPRLGMIGAALATMLSYVLLWIVVSVMCRGFGLRFSKKTLVVFGAIFLPLLPGGLGWLLRGPGGLATHPKLVVGLSDFGLILSVGVVIYGCTRRTWILSVPERQVVYAELGRLIQRAKTVLVKRA